MFRANNFDKLLDKATSNLRLDPDWPTILQICDLIRQNDCSPKYAVAAVKKKLYSQNPHQAMFALLTLESIVKNCGSGVHDEVTTKVFCEMLRDLVKTTQHENLRSKILELIQAWAFAFRNAPKYRAVQDTVNILKAEGYKFPPLKESDAMFSADTAPEWADGEVCHRCRVAFSLMVRRHHCRACGQVFCQQCSSKTSTLPKFGIEREVRVCDACFDKVSRPPSSTAKLEIVDTANDYGPAAAQPQKKLPGGKTAEELQEEEELQLALALSQSEAEQKEKERKSRSHIVPDSTPNRPTLSPTPSSVSASPDHSNQANSELSRYLDRNYWEQRLSRDTTAAPTAPAPASQASNDTNEDFPKPSTTKTQDDDAEDKEIDEFVETLKSQVEIFVNRMKSNSSRGRSIANDTAVQTLFMNITAMHSRLLKYIQQQDDKRVYLESLQDKVTQIRDSRAALDTLRAEHAARIAAAAEAAERQRQMQMMAKLQAMRKKKHEYLQYQRQLALQRVQEQEREMQMRQEQQKHQYLMSANSYYMPGVSVSQYQAGYPNQPMYGNPQFHQMGPQATTDGTMPMPGQPQMSQANMPMNINPMATIAQSMPQLPTTYAMSSSVAGQPASAQPSMNQANIRQPLNQHQMQQQMMMQQMHQMRMPVQPGVHQMITQNVNGLPGQNGQTQLQKQNMPNQVQSAAMMPPNTIGQPLMNPSNAILGMQIQNMRMPMMQGNPNANQPGYPMNMQNQPNNLQPGTQPQNVQPSSLPQQMNLPGQQILQSQLPGQPQSMPQMMNNIQTSSQSTQPQITQTQPHQMPSQNQQPIVHGQQIGIPGHPIAPPGHQSQVIMQTPQMQGQPGLQGQNVSQGQGMINQPQQITPAHLSQQMGQQMQPSPMQQQMPATQVQNQGPQAPMQNQLPQAHIQNQLPQAQMPAQLSHSPAQNQMPQSQMQNQMPQQMQPGQQVAQMSTGQVLPQNIQATIKAQSNFSSMPQNQQSPMPNQQQHSAQTPPNKSEHNNNTAELISFD